MGLAGMVGYVLRKFHYEVAPLCLAFILGPVMENSFRQSLIMSGGDFSIFVTRPITACTFAVTVLLILLMAFRKNKVVALDLDS
jgi:putative tricarboxylic transport membrane protein